LGANHTYLLVVAASGPTSVVTRRVPLPPYSAPSTAFKEQVQRLSLDAAYRDTRLYPGLDGSKHFTEQHLISVLPTNQTATIEDIKTATVETYETIRDLFNLYRTLASSSAQELLVKFDFIMEWPSLSADKKNEKYSEFSCHELNFFLYHKDKPFFESVIKPFLANKLVKTFMDHWFLGNHHFVHFTFSSFGSFGI
jgi:hypothetical protein